MTTALTDDTPNDKSTTTLISAPTTTPTPRKRKHDATTIIVNDSTDKSVKSQSLTELWSSAPLAKPSMSHVTHGTSVESNTTSTSSNSNSNIVGEDKRGLLYGTWHLNAEFKMAKHQIDGADRMYTRAVDPNMPRGTVLGDEAGVGKTCQIVRLLMQLLHDYESNPDTRFQLAPHVRPGTIESSNLCMLVAFPKSVIDGWVKVFRATSSEFAKLVYVCTDSLRKPKKIPPKSARILLTTHSQLVTRHKDQHWIEKRHWHAVVIDEAHVIQNYETKLTTVVLGLNRRISIAMTGTPQNNTPIDLAPLFQFALHNTGLEEGTREWWQKNWSKPALIRAVVDAHMIRRSRSILEGSHLQFPKPYIREIGLRLSIQQREMVSALLNSSKLKAFANDDDINDDGNDDIDNNDDVDHMNNDDAFTNGRYNGGYIDMSSSNTNNKQNRKKRRKLNGVKSNDGGGSIGKKAKIKVLPMINALVMTCTSPSLVRHPDLIVEPENNIGDSKLPITDPSMLSSRTDIKKSKTKKKGKKKKKAKMNKTDDGVDEGDDDNCDSDSDDEDDDVTNGVNDLSWKTMAVEDIIESSPKIKMLLEVAQEHVLGYNQPGSTRHPMVIMSASTRVLALHKRVLEHQFPECFRGNPMPILQGSVTSDDRTKMINDFQDGKHAFMGLSIKSGGTGITLTRAGHVWFASVWWNPFADEQALARVLRATQIKVVTVWLVRMVDIASIENLIIGCSTRKRSSAAETLEDHNISETFGIRGRSLKSAKHDRFASGNRGVNKKAMKALICAKFREWVKDQKKHAHYESLDHVVAEKEAESIKSAQSNSSSGLTGGTDVVDIANVKRFARKQQPTQRAASSSLLGTSLSLPVNHRALIPAALTTKSIIPAAKITARIREYDGDNDNDADPNLEIITSSRPVSNRRYISITGDDDYDNDNDSRHNQQPPVQQPKRPITAVNDHESRFGPAVSDEQLTQLLTTSRFDDDNHPTSIETTTPVTQAV